MVFTENSAQHCAALADGQVVRERRLQHRHQVLAPARRALDGGAMTVDDGLRAARTKLLQGAGLSELMTRADLHDLDRAELRVGVAIDADYDALARLDPQLHPIGAVSNATLDRKSTRLNSSHVAIS